MQKVLMVACNGLGNGGIVHVMMNIVRNLSNEFHFDMLLFTDDVRYFDAEFQKYGTIFRIPHKGKRPSLRYKLDYFVRFPRIYWGVKKILRENGPYDIIHCHNYLEAAPCILAAAHCGVPVRISHSHNAFLRLPWSIELLHSIYRKIVNRYATHKIGCSRLATDYLFGKNVSAISIPNAIDLNRFDISRYPQQKIKHSFVHVGSFGESKNQSFVLDVFSIVQTHWPDATLKLVGNKNEAYEQILHQKIKDLGLKNVILLPPNADIPALFAQSEYMIFPSLFEGFGLVLAEAQAMGVKCFASDVIPREADIGLCQYVSLNLPAEQWANAIFESENKPIPTPDTAKVSLPTYIDKIRRMYNQEAK